MTDEVFSIVNYKRSNTCWVCPECETENQMDFIRCLVCGTARTTSCKVCVPWEVEQERIRERAAITRVQREEVLDRIETPEEVQERYVEPQGGSIAAKIVIVVLLILIAALAGVCVYMMNM